MISSLREVLRSFNPLLTKSLRTIYMERSLREDSKREYQTTLRVSAYDRLHRVPAYSNASRKDNSVPSSRDLTTTKAHLRETPRDFQVPRKFGFITPVTYGQTSGTSGTPLSIRRTLSDVAIEEAFQNWWRNQIGWSNDSKVAVLRGAFPREFAKGDLSLEILGTKRFLLNTFRISRETINDYVEILKSQKPEVIYAYPSAIVELARLISESEIEIQGVKTIVTSSETFSAENRNFVKAIFKCDVFDWYGNAERTAAAGQCSQGRYHFFWNYADVGLDESGELIATPLRWTGTQLANYKTGDLVEDLRSDKCACGWLDPHALAITGRLDDYVVSLDGSRIGRLDGIFKGEYSIIESQIVQKHDGTLLLSLVCPTRDEAALSRIKERLSTRVPGRSIQANFVDTIERTATGKLKSVIREH